MRSNDTLYFMLGDHLGSTSITTDANGAKVSEMRYKPCPLYYVSGVLREGEVRSWWTASLSTTPAYKLAEYTFTGQYSHMDDPSTAGVTEGFGLMFYNARWMDPVLGRFVQADTIIPPGVQGLDRYAYTNNNPVRYIDPSGHGPCDYSNADPECFAPDPWQSPSYTFTQLPVVSDDITWTQPFGNTEKAWNLAPNNGYNYCGYAQCLHAGIDIGAPAGIPVYAGVYGTWHHHCSGKNCNYGPGWVMIMTTDGYLILYGHITPVTKINGTITPDTIIGHIADLGTSSHVHVEVSRGGNYYNPAVLMEPKVREQYLSHVEENAFHEIPGEPRLWDNPLNQPIIHHGGTPVWVTLGICDDKGYGPVTIGGVFYPHRHLGVKC